MPRPLTDPDSVNLRGWPSGTNNVRDLRDLQRGENPALRDALNVDISSSGKVRRRKGRALVQAGQAHSLWAPKDWPLGFLVLNGQLTALRNDGGTETLTALGGVSPTAPAVYCEQNSYVYGTNGLTSFRVDRAGALSAWGVPMPQGMPLATPIANGSIPPGRYQLTLTHLDATGEESGARAPILIEMATDGAIRLDDIPVSPPGVVSVRFYLSPQNGDQLYHAKTVPAGTTSYTLYSATDLGKGLETLHCERVPPSRWLCSYKGRIYFAIGDTVYYTLPLRFGLFKPHQTYFRFPYRIVGIAATDDALIVGTESSMHRLQGNDPADMTMLPIDANGAVQGTLYQIPGGVLPGEGFNGGNVLWWSTKGVLMRAQPGGIVTPVTQGRLSVPRFAAGSLMYREQDEIAQIVSILRGPQTPAAFAATDRAEAEVFRNGIAI